MLTRILTSVVGIPLVIAVVAIGNPLLRYVIMAVSLIALYEFYRVVGKQHKPIVAIGYVAVAFQYIAFNGVIKEYFIFITCVTMVSLIILVLCYPKYSVVDIGLTLLPVLYVGLMFSFMILIRDVNDGGFWIWLIAISAWGSDTFAYFTGKSIGRHNLAPVLSPKKTIEGSVGGIIGAAILAYIYTIIYTQYGAFGVREQVLWVVIGTALGAAISQFGDLAASAIKRFYKEKDYGNILPGHGGILDRFDSFIFVAPVIYGMYWVAQYLQ